MARNFAQSLLDSGQFTLTYELVPSRGGRGKMHERAMALALDAAADGRLQAVSITENAGGHPVLSPEVLGSEIKQMGLDVIIHLSCKDKNRNQMESLLFAWDRENLHNLLVITGDYPQQGYRGNPKPVFDLGAIHALDLIGRLNCEQDGFDRRNPAVKSYHPTTFFKGVAVSPFKHLEAEVMMQYYKLHRKEENGADYIITQVGYDARKFDELLRYMKQTHIDLPVLGNVFIPNVSVARMMNAGKIPGCVVTDEFLALMEGESQGPDQGRKARLVRGAKLMSVLRGLGYDGAHIGGPGLTYEDLAFLIERSQQYDRDWQALVPELAFWPRESFHVFEKSANGLNEDVPTKHAGSFGKSVHYRMSEAMHNAMFEEDGIIYGPAKKICLHFDSGSLATAFSGLEHFIKFLLYRCRNCGDCTLSELSYICPQRGCAKYLLNGACGGSRNGWCEVYPGRRRCFYVRVYERLKAAGIDEVMKSGFVPPRDWSLNNTSSWINFYKGLDHTNPRK